MIRRLLAVVAAGWAVAAGAVEPAQFANGIELQADSDQPLLELVLPDAVYAGVQRADLADLRVFNTQHVAVPHALCDAPLAPPGVEEHPLPVFSLRAAARARSGGVDVQVRGDGNASVRVDVRPASRAEGESQQATRLSGYVIDARSAPGVIRALRLKWQTADAASGVAVRVEASDDLDRWHTVVAQTTLLRVDAAGSVLERTRIALPEARYSYLRVARADSGPEPDLAQVIAEAVVPAEQDEALLRWFDAPPASLPAQQPGFGFDAGRRAPVLIARIELPLPNMALTASLQSRASAQAAWQTRWTGEVFALGSGDAQRRNADIRFAATTDPLWRVRVTQGEESLGAAAPRLRLGYRPARLRFLAQGATPFVLAYGSGRADPAPRRDCADLLQQLPRTELEQLIGQAQAGEPRTLGGEAALKPAPKALPTRQIVLWALLVVGALLLLAMALSLMRRARR